MCSLQVFGLLGRPYRQPSVGDRQVCRTKTMLNWRFPVDAAENAIYVVVSEKNEGDWFRI